MVNETFSGLIVDEKKLISEAIDQKLHIKLGKSVVTNFMNYEILGIPTKYFVLVSFIGTLTYRILKIR